LKHPYLSLNDTGQVSLHILEFGCTKENEAIAARVMIIQDLYTVYHGQLHRRAVAAEILRRPKAALLLTLIHEKEHVTPEALKSFNLHQAAWAEVQK